LRLKLKLQSKVSCFIFTVEDSKQENGGELVIFKEENGIEVEKNIYPMPGKMVIFESQMLEHELKSIKTSGLSITGWLKTR